MKIRTLLTAESIQKAIDQVRDYQNRFYTGFLSAIEELCDVAADVCREAYGEDVSVVSVPTATKYDARIARFEIRANGEHVAFLEFGAGDATDVAHMFAGSAPFTVRPGSYSETHAKKYSTYGYWYYRKKRYYFIQPQRGLFKASEYIKDELRDTIRSSIR